MLGVDTKNTICGGLQKDSLNFLYKMNRICIPIFFVDSIFLIVKIELIHPKCD